MRLRGSRMWCSWGRPRHGSRQQSRRQRRDDVHIVSTTNQPPNHQPPSLTTNHQPTSQSTAADRTNQPPRTNYHRRAKLSIPICHHHHATVETMCTSSLQTNHQQTTAKPNHHPTAINQPTIKPPTQTTIKPPTQTTIKPPTTIHPTRTPSPRTRHYPTPNVNKTLLTFHQAVDNKVFRVKKFVNTMQ